MNPSEYQRYLCSREWALLKEQVRERSHGKCERCGGPYSQVHHLTYERIGHELPTDLIGVCDPCHEFLSGKSNTDPVLSPQPVMPESTTYNKIKAQGRKLTEQIAAAESNHDERRLEKLLKRKELLNRIQAQHVYFGNSPITEQH